MKQKRFLVALLPMLALACAQAPEYSTEDLRVDDGFSDVFGPSLRGHYALGTEVEFRLTDPVEGAVSRIELVGDIFEWSTEDDGSLRARAARTGSGELLVYIDEELVRSAHVAVEAPSAATTSFDAPVGLELMRFSCDDCAADADDGLPRYARGADAAMRLHYQNDEGVRLAGRGIGDDEFVVADETRDVLELFTDIEGLFALPVNVDGRQLLMVQYRVVEADSIRIIDVDLGSEHWYFAEVLSEGGLPLRGEVTWTLDGEATETEGGVIQRDVGDAPAELRATIGRVAATLTI